MAVVWWRSVICTPVVSRPSRQSWIRAADGPSWRRWNITERDDVATMMTAIRERWRRLDGLVHVAALDTPVGGIENGDLDDWDRVSRVNVRGTLEVTKAALGLLGRGSAIVVIGSIGAV